MYMPLMGIQQVLALAKHTNYVKSQPEFCLAEGVML